MPAIHARPMLAVGMVRLDDRIAEFSSLGTSFAVNVLCVAYTMHIKLIYAYGTTDGLPPISLP